jgi:hypothetical protein
LTFPVAWIKRFSLLYTADIPGETQSALIKVHPSEYPIHNWRQFFIHNSDELFGFYRPRAISRGSAELIARAAQQDDITVLTAALVPLELAGA